LRPGQPGRRKAAASRDSTELAEVRTPKNQPEIWVTYFNLSRNKLINRAISMEVGARQRLMNALKSKVKN
jgi:hypothetical protein